MVVLCVGLLGVQRFWEERGLEDPEDFGGMPMIRECEKRKRLGLDARGV